MDKKEAIDFLKKYQPLPNDEFMDEYILEKYDEVREYFQENPDEECIPLFLNSFGNGSGFGIYQLIEDVIIRFPKNIVIPYLQNALSSNNESICYWNAQIASNFPDNSLINYLAKLINSKNSDIRWASAVALGQIKDLSVKTILEKQLLEEDDSNNREIIEGLLSDF